MMKDEVFIEGSRQAAQKAIAKFLRKKIDIE
jgi:hypothetical protein